MGKNANKKGKQKETTSVVPTSTPAPPPPPPPPPPPAGPIIQAPSPPAAKHIRHPPMAAIEEEDAQAGPSGDPYEGTQEWQDLGQQEDVTEGSWAVGSVVDPGNGNEDWGVANDDSHWETNSAAAPPQPPQPPPPPQQKNPGRSRAQARHQQQQFTQPHQQRHEQQHKQHANASSMGTHSLEPTRRREQRDLEYRQQP
ncbi:hypothetical protein EDD15DRAFT_1274302 [Pisolithus albus]|nr:hypothetical protein EDD15DRAFT_1274302 [Pisolithus albus]